MNGFALTVGGLAILMAAAALVHHASKRWPRAGTVLAASALGAIALFLAISILTGSILQSSDSPGGEGVECRGERAC
ncbi:hypothetical protein [Sphingomonas sp.]|uniref:hypothetical protein n=1 Tax=Sphingomonas sp. TaxID=28214 RepID=UPI00307F011D